MPTIDLHLSHPVTSSHRPAGSAVHVNKPTWDERGRVTTPSLAEWSFTQRVCYLLARAQLCTGQQNFSVRSQLHEHTANCGDVPVCVCACMHVSAHAHVPRSILIWAPASVSSQATGYTSRITGKNEVRRSDATTRKLIFAEARHNPIGCCVIEFDER